MRLSWTQIAPGTQCRESTFTSRCHEVLDRSTFSQEALCSAMTASLLGLCELRLLILERLMVRSEVGRPRQVDLLPCLLPPVRRFAKHAPIGTRR